MTTELDPDDAVGNVTGDRARRELDELRGENERLNRICNEQVASIDAMELEMRRMYRERDKLVRVLKGMVDYSECNDPGNPWLNGARAVLSDEREVNGE